MPLARLGIGGFTLLLTLVLALMLAGLYATDRLLQAGASAQAESDAAQAATILEHALTSRGDGLVAFGAATAAGVERERVFQELAGRYRSIYQGVVRVALDAEDGTPPLVANLDATNLGLEPAMIPGGRGMSLQRAPGGGDWLVVIAEPLSAGNSAPGRVSATFHLDSLLAVAARGAAPQRRALLLVAGGDTVRWPHLEAGDTASLRAPAFAPVRLSSLRGWSIGVLHQDEATGLRLSLWAMGVLTAILLAVGVIRERRQAIRIGERSAELERLSTELLRANRMKSEFLANVSHELRTPLNAIVGFVELLKDGVYGELSPRQITPVDRIAVSATHLRHLVDQVLDIAKIAAGRIELQTETIGLRGFVLNVVSELEPLFGERGLALSITVPATLPKVRTDTAHLRQVLVNLIGNAVKYTSEGSVTVRARVVGTAPGGRPTPGDEPALLARAPDRSHNWVALQVIDTGVGIAPPDQERIFDEFEQVNAGSRRDSIERGTGLGLAISRRLARLLGGDLTVESQVGKGSTFTVWLPIDPASESKGAAVSPA